VIDLASGEILHSLDLPEPIDELFDVVVLPGVRQPRALGLQGEEIDCLVKIPDQPELLHVRPMAPSGKPHQGPSVRPFGLPEPSAADASAAAAAPPSGAPIHYQRVFHLTPANLAPYAALTFPTLAPGSSALSRIEGELLGLSAMAAGVMVGFAIAERRADGGAQLLSLKVDPLWRRRGIGTGLLQRLMVFLAKEGIAPLSLRYKASPEISTRFEPMLSRLGWSQCLFGSLGAVITGLGVKPSIAGIDRHGEIAVGLSQPGLQTARHGCRVGCRRIASRQMPRHQGSSPRRRSSQRPWLRPITSSARPAHSRASAS